MNYFTGASVIIITFVVVLCIISLRRRAEFVLNFLLRTIVGVISIFFVIEMLAAQNYAVSVGINPWTALTSGILGLPGVALLYGINFLKIL